jgi:predicted nucleic acid-binding protein
MKSAVLDSWALMALYKDEPAADEVEERLAKASESGEFLSLCLINWGEVVYQFERLGGKAAAESVIAEIEQLPIELIPVDKALTRQAAAFKARGGLSYADCFAAALAKERKTELLTGDAEFRTLEKEIKICWLK